MNLPSLPTEGATRRGTRIAAAVEQPSAQGSVGDGDLWKQRSTRPVADPARRRVTAHRHDRAPLPTRLRVVLLLSLGSWAFVVAVAWLILN
jgi:hypothetical protein